jgi:hypothetical protein
MNDTTRSLRVRLNRSPQSRKSCLASHGNRGFTRCTFDTIAEAAEFSDHAGRAGTLGALVEGGAAFLITNPLAQDVAASRGVSWSMLKRFSSCFARFRAWPTRPEKRGSGLPSVERGAQPFRTARPVAGLRRVFRAMPTACSDGFLRENAESVERFMNNPGYRATKAWQRRNVMST